MNKVILFCPVGRKNILNLDYYERIVKAINNENESIV